MSINSGLFSSKTDMWSTPQKTFDDLNCEFNFDVDVCATRENSKCEVFYSPEDDGLSIPWSGVCWMNPPYGRDIKNWVKKAYESDATVVCLLPSRTDTSWWHDYCMKSDDIRFIRGRLKFGGSKNSAPFPSVVVVFKGAGK